MRRRDIKTSRLYSLLGVYFPPSKFSSGDRRGRNSAPVSYTSSAPLPGFHLFPQFYPHGPCDVLCLPVCCVWVSGSQRPWQFCLSDQTHPRCDFHNTKPKTDWRPSKAESRLQRACSVTVCTVAPLRTGQLQSRHCQNPSDCGVAVSTCPNNMLYLNISPTSDLQSRRWCRGATLEWALGAFKCFMSSCE